MAKRVAFAHIRMWIDFETYEEACKFIDKEDEKRAKGKRGKMWSGDGQDVPRRPSKPFGYSGSSEDFDEYKEYKAKLAEYYDAIIDKSNADDGIYTIVAYQEYKDYNPGW